MSDPRPPHNCSLLETPFTLVLLGFWAGSLVGSAAGVGPLLCVDWRGLCVPALTDSALLELEVHSWPC